MGNIEALHFVKGLDPVADAFAGTINSDVVNMANWGKCTFIVYYGVGTTGTVTFTVESCDDATPTTTQAVVFHSRTITTGDTPGALTARANTGYTTTAGSSQIQIIEVRNEALTFLGANAYSWVRLHGVESVNDPILGGICAMLSEPRFGDAVNQTVIA